MTVGEFYRIHIMQQEIGNSFCNERSTARLNMRWCSYRQDKITNLNVGVAKTKFYKFIRDDMGLDSNNRKYKDGKLVYTLEFVSVNGTSNPAVFNVKGYASARSFVFRS